MSLTKKLLLTVICVSAVMLASTKVLAASSDEVQVRRLEMAFETYSLRVNQERTLYVEVFPYNATDKVVYWSSSNEEVVMVDGDGMITGIGPGTATVTATWYSDPSDRYTGDKSATCVVTVSGTVLNEMELQTSNSENAAAAIDGGERLSAQSLRVDVENAAGDTANGGTIQLNYTGKTVVSTTALRSADYTARTAGKTAELKFSTSDGKGGVQGHLTIDPAKASADAFDIQLSVQVNPAELETVRTEAASRFGGSAYVAQLSQQGAFGMEVRVAANFGLTAEQVASAGLYYYKDGTYTNLENPQIQVGNNGYLYFTANQGGTIVAVIK